MQDDVCDSWNGACSCSAACHRAAGAAACGKKNGASVCPLSVRRLFPVSFLVKGKGMDKKASMTVEAALICPFLCLVLCGMLVFTLKLYETVDLYTKELIKRQVQILPSPELIRLEAVAEDLF